VRLEGTKSGGALQAPVPEQPVVITPTELHA